MAFTFPLSLADFFDLLPVSSVTFDAQSNVEMSETGAGEILTADLGVALWHGQIDLGVVTNDEFASIVPLLNLLKRAGSSFLVCDPRRKNPRLDRSGLLLQGSSPTIHSLHANNREIRIAGIPPGFPLSRGDLIGFTYGSNPVRYGLHELIGASDANASGITGFMEVTPPIRPGASVGAAVQLTAPRCKAVIHPNSIKTGTSRRLITRDVSFSWVQTLR